MVATDTFLERLLVRDDRFTDEQVAQTLQMLVEYGAGHGASGIHIEPRERHVLVRYRLGGTLGGLHKLPVASCPALMQQLKLMAGLDPLETRAPQEGNYDVLVGNRTLNIDVSIMPTLSGEKAVLHLTPAAETSKLESLGFWGQGLKLINETLARPYGLVLVSSHRRNGLTTTLQSLKSMLNTPAAEQVEFFDNLSGKAALKSAVNAVLRGRMALAGVHADGAINGLVRLNSLGLEPFLLASSFRLAIGQRLVRRLCPSCRKRHALNEAERRKIQLALGITKPTQVKKIHQLEQAAAEHGMNEAPLSSTPQHITHLWSADKNGCEECRDGFKGHIAITEVLANGENLRKSLSAKTSAASELHNSALKDGFVPMELDGLVKSLRGLTAIEEVLKPYAT